MNWIAWKMLTGDRAKYLGTIFGVAFGCLLISQQSAVFVSILRRTASQIVDVADADLWVIDPQTLSIDDLWALGDNTVLAVRGVEGVEWAVPFYKGMVTARQPSGHFRQAILLGLDDSSLVGAPRTMLMGKLADLRRPDAVILDKAGYRYLFPDEPMELWRTLEINDRRAVIVGICEASPPFQSLPILYTRFSLARDYAPKQRRELPVVLAKASPGVSTPELASRIETRTGLATLHRREFAWKTIQFYLRSTGIPINFGITIALGFIVGTAIAGQTFYLFTIENLKQFGNLKAMGTTNSRLLGMVLLQAAIVGGLGFGFGIGAAALEVFGLTAVSMAVIVFLASIMSAWRVLVLEPAEVFR
ncbi:MAG: ABC transporter permease [Planctomycetota bacterium]|nr:ABC transporter permease [Planctomycetota bacterium]